MSWRGGGGSDGSKWSRVRLDGESVGRDGGSGVGDGNGCDIGGVDGGRRCFGNGFEVGVEGIGGAGYIGGIVEQARVEVVGRWR